MARFPALFSTTPLRGRGAWGWGLLGASLCLAGCAPIPFGSQSVIGPSPTPTGVVAVGPCTPADRAQATRLNAALLRARLGMDKLAVAALLGPPAHAETFALTNGHAIEVFFYHTAETICRTTARDEALLPLVFQDERLLGYGQNYYHSFIVPLLRTSLSNIHENQMFGASAVPSAAAQVPIMPGPALQARTPRYGRMMEEDLPTLTAPTRRMEAGKAKNVGYDASQINQIGAGVPLR